MNGEKRPLPDFERPPVIEVALSVQFEPLSSFRAVHFGLLWEQFRSRFPRTQEQPALMPVIEKFGVRSIPGQTVSFGIGIGAPEFRCWFLDDLETQLIQIQRDRFIHNWRKTSEGSPYPRYKTLREKFKDELETFAAFLKSEGIAGTAPQPVRVDLCESHSCRRGVGGSRSTGTNRYCMAVTL